MSLQNDIKEALALYESSRDAKSLEEINVIESTLIGKILIMVAKLIQGGEDEEVKRDTTEA